VVSVGECGDRGEPFWRADAVSDAAPDAAAAAVEGAIATGEAVKRPRRRFNREGRVTRAGIIEVQTQSGNATY